MAIWKIMIEIPPNQTLFETHKMCVDKLLELGEIIKHYTTLNNYTIHPLLKDIPIGYLKHKMGCLELRPNDGLYCSQEHFIGFIHPQRDIYELIRFDPRTGDIGLYTPRIITSLDEIGLCDAVYLYGDLWQDLYYQERI